jgi:hypothetical protein
VLMPEHVHLLLTEPKLQRLYNTLRVLTNLEAPQRLAIAVLAEPLL